MKQILIAIIIALCISIILPNICLSNEDIGKQDVLQEQLMKQQVKAVVTEVINEQNNNINVKEIIGIIVLAIIGIIEVVFGIDIRNKITKIQKQ